MRGQILIGVKNAIKRGQISNFIGSFKHLLPKFRRSSVAILRSGYVLNSSLTLLKPLLRGEGISSASSSVSSFAFKFILLRYDELFRIAYWII